MEGCPAPQAHDAAQRHRVVIVGAGFGGLAAARALNGHRDVEITIIDKQNHHLFQPLLYQVATAALSPTDIAAPIRTIVKDDLGTSVLLETVCGIDTDARRVQLTSGASIAYDTLIIATGARHSYFGNDHWERHAPGIKTLDDATRVRRSVLIAMERAETARQEDPIERAKLLTFVVIGGGPTGVEMAGAIAELTRQAAAMDFRHLTPNCVRIVLVEAGPRLLAAFPETLGRAAERALGKLGVEVRLGAPVTNIDADGVDLDGARLPAGAIVWAAGVEASPAAKWLGVESDRAGRVPVTNNLSVSGHSDIFVIGDTAAIADAGGRPVPGVATAAKQQGRYVARLIAARLAGRAPTKPFIYRNLGNLATVGRRQAVVDLGWLRFDGLAAWLFWSTVHVYFLVGFRNRFVVGANWIWNYLTFERGARLITGLPDARWPEQAGRAELVTDFASARHRFQRRNA